MRTSSLKVPRQDRFNCDVVVDRLLNRSRERNMWYTEVIGDLDRRGDRTEIRYQVGWLCRSQVQCALNVTGWIGYRSCYRRILVWLTDKSGHRCR